LAVFFSVPEGGVLMSEKFFVFTLKNRLIIEILLSFGLGGGLAAGVYRYIILFGFV
jgi:hypothetical protein